MLRDAAGQQYPPILTDASARAGLGRHRRPEQGGPIAALPFLQEHGDITSLGVPLRAARLFLRLSGLPEASVAALAGTRDLDRGRVALPAASEPFQRRRTRCRWIERIKPRRAILTNMHTDLDYEELRSKLPPHVEPAFDGLKLVLPAAALA